MLQAVHTVSAVAEQAVLAYWVAVQVVHVAHVSAVPLTRYLPAAQTVHCESLAVVHVTGEAQPATGVHAPHTVSETAVQAALTYWPAAHVPHGLHTVSAAAAHAILAYWPAPQTVHAVQSCVSDVPPPEHALPLLYWPAAHA